MRKLIAAINMTVDGFCDHTAVTAGEEIHDHYTNLIRNAHTILYGRITYQLMEYWKAVLKNPTGNRSMDEFAVEMNKVPKIVFSSTLKDVDWESARLAHRTFEEEVLDLKQSHNGDRDIYVGSPSLIVTASKLNLIDEYQLCVHPVIAGKGLPLFKNVNGSKKLELSKTKIFKSGAIILYYVPSK